MNRIPFLTIAAATLLAPPLHAQQRSSADYTLAPEITNGSTGGRATSATYTLDSVTGTSPASGGSSATYVAKTNFAGQLYDVVAIALSTAANPADESSTVQLTADLTLDDGSTLLSGLVGWSILSGPASSVDATGLASTAAVYQPSSATVQAEQDGVTETIAFNVADTNPDNFGAYAADNLADSWQVTHFGLPPNADAAPSANPDKDINDNITEFLAGYDPNDSKDFFQFTVLDKSGATATFQLSKMIPGTDYKLFSSTGLAFPATPINTFTVGVETPDALIQDTAAPAGANFYYLQLQKQ